MWVGFLGGKRRRVALLVLCVTLIGLTSCLGGEVAGAPRIILERGQSKQIALAKGALLLAGFPSHTPVQEIQANQIVVSSPAGAEATVHETGTDFGVNLDQKDCCQSMWGYLTVTRPGTYTVHFLAATPEQQQADPPGQLIVVRSENARALSRNGSALQIRLLLAFFGAAAVVLPIIIAGLYWKASQRRKRSVRVVNGSDHSATWAADPTGRFAWRWWDGERWTDQGATSDGTRVDDPL